VILRPALSGSLPFSVTIFHFIQLIGSFFPGFNIFPRPLGDLSFGRPGPMSSWNILQRERNNYARFPS
jgi:hypothetical protein